MWWYDNGALTVECAVYGDCQEIVRSGHSKSLEIFTPQFTVSRTATSRLIKPPVVSTAAHNQHFSTMVNILLLTLLLQVTLLLALPTAIEQEDIDTRVVNRPDQEPQNPAITGSLVQDVKQINILLNIPDGCTAIYDSMINQLESCKRGEDRGHPGLDNGCLLKIDFQRYNKQCKNSKLSFPSDEETPWHPEPSCHGEYCQ